VTIDSVEVSAADIAKIPAGNVRVPRADFVALWQTAERLWRRYGTPPLEYR
jgi:hypothetical protein